MDRLHKKLEHGACELLCLHMPDIREIPCLWQGIFLLQKDITEINGFSHLHHPVDLIKNAQERCRAYKRRTFAVQLMEVQEKDGGRFPPHEKKAVIS